MASENKNSFSPNTSDFIVQFALLLIGLALAFSADRFVNILNNSALPPADKLVGGFHFVTLFIVLVVWLHAEIAYEAIETYNNRSSILSTVVEYWLEILNLVIPVFAALNVGNTANFGFSLVLIYMFDMILALFTLFRQGREGIKHTVEFQTCERWFIIDLLTAVTVLIFIYIPYLQSKTLLQSGLIFSTILVSSVLDYTFNKTFYFGNTASDQS